MAGLPARLTAGLTPQRPGLGCRLGQSVRRRRSAGVAGVRGQPSLQFTDPRLRPLQLGANGAQFLTKRNDQRGKHLNRRWRQVVGHSPTLRPEPPNPLHRTESGASTTTRTRPTDLKDLTSYARPSHPRPDIRGNTHAPAAHWTASQTQAPSVAWVCSWRRLFAGCPRDVLPATSFGTPIHHLFPRAFSSPVGLKLMPRSGPIGRSGLRRSL